MRQSSSPTGASENPPSIGGVSFARATPSPVPRSGPNQGLPRAPFTGLRVVATRSTGVTESADASERVLPVDARPAHPPSVKVETAAVSARSTLRRETAGAGVILLRTIASKLRTRRKRPGVENDRASQGSSVPIACLPPDRGRSRAEVEWAPRAHSPLRGRAHSTEYEILQVRGPANTILL
jgi:hypothetical protein